MGMSECHCPHMSKTEGEDEGGECGKSVCMCAHVCVYERHQETKKRGEKKRELNNLDIKDQAGNTDQDQEKTVKLKVCAIRS